MLGFVQVQGIPTNLEYLAAVAADKRFVAGGYAGLHLLGVLLCRHQVSDDTALNPGGVLLWLLLVGCACLEGSMLALHGRTSHVNQ